MESVVPNASKILKRKQITTFAYQRMARVEEGINPTKADTDTLAFLHELIQAIREVEPLK